MSVFDRVGGRAVWAVVASIGLVVPGQATAQERAYPGKAVPDVAEVSAAYEGDLANARVQSLGDYRGWVRTFYEGNFLSAGWNQFGAEAIGAVRSPDAQRAVASEVSDLGRIIGLEWAKDSSVRRISTNDLRGWYATMTEARRDDDGSGRWILDALRTVRRTAEDRSRRS